MLAALLLNLGWGRPGPREPVDRLRQELKPVKTGEQQEITKTVKFKPLSKRDKAKLSTDEYLMIWLFGED